MASVVTRFLRVSSSLEHFHSWAQGEINKAKYLGEAPQLPSPVANGVY